MSAVGAAMCYVLEHRSCLHQMCILIIYIWLQANAEKKRLEVKQRAVRKAAEQSHDPLEPRWFQELPNSKAGETAMYDYKGGYWEARKLGDWQGCRDIFGQVS